jgi:hypothetical protein
MSSSFHPQTDGQTGRVNQTLETYRQHFVSVGLDDWDTLLSHAEFAHNAACYDCAWLSLTALSTVTYNLWL